MSVPINNSTVTELAVSVAPTKLNGAANASSSPLEEMLWGVCERIQREDEKNVVGQAKEIETNPVERLMKLNDQGLDITTVLAAMNKSFAVTKYGEQIVIATLIGNDINFMKLHDFHKMFANLINYKGRPIKVSKRWFEWEYRRRYLGRGVVFEPGGPVEIPNDMLNLWRGFGIVPKQGDWSLMRTHILNVVCSGQQEQFDYLIRWMAYGVQHPDEPMGVAVAFLGAPGAGKGIVARTFGKFFGKHFTHIANGDQLTSRFNASLGTSCVVFLDEALWAGDRRGEGVLKALITEPTFQLEAKFRDAIMVDNRLRIIVASNNDWAVPTGIGDRRWFVLNVANTYAGTKHRDYWKAVYAEIGNGGAAAMLHNLLAIDLSEFDVRAVPHTAAKAQQQERSFRGTISWLNHILQDGAIGWENWNEAGLTITKDHAYDRYKEFSKERRDWQPEIKDLWSKKIRAVLDPYVNETRPNVAGNRVRSFTFAPLAECRRQFETYVGAPNIEWEPVNEPDAGADTAVRQTAGDVGVPNQADALHDAPNIEWEPDLESEPDSTGQNTNQNTSARTSGSIER